MWSPFRSGVAADLAALDPDDLTALVADLWSALGWETAVDGRTVTVERPGERRIVHVLPARGGLDRLRRPDSPADADVVVDAGGSRRVRSAALESGAEYVGPREVRDRLRYAVPRETGRALAAEYLGRPLHQETTGGPEWSVRDVLAALGVVGVVLAVVLAGPVGLLPTLQGGSAGTPTSADGGTVPSTASPVTPATPTAATPTGAPTETEDRYPAGLSATGVENASALAASHVTELRNRDYAVTVTFEGPPEARGFGNWTSVRWAVRVESSHNFALEANYSGGNMTPTGVGVYANGVLLYRRISIGNDTRYEALPAEARDASGYLFVVANDVEDYLEAPRTAVQRVETDDGIRYRVVATGTPPALSGDVDDYRAEATVTQEGRVTLLSVSYTLVVDGEPRSVQVTYDYSEYDEAVVERPWWYEAARNATGQ